jgi:transposase
MAHSEDLRRRVVKYIRQGGSKAEASRRYDIGLRTIYEWLECGDEQAPRKPGPKGASKIDMKKLAKMVGERGTDLMLREMAKEFSVDQSAVSKALKRLGVSRKKNHEIRGGKEI